MRGFIFLYMNNLERVRPEDFDVAELWQAAREGNLFIVKTVKPADCETAKKNVRAYVQRIDSFVTRPFRASIDALWEDVFSCDELMALLMPKPRAKKCRDFDKYSVMRIIGVLREHGVYEQYSDRKFMALLEQTEEEREAFGTLRAGIDPVFDAYVYKNDVKTNLHTDSLNFTYWDLEKKGFRTFSAARIVKIIAVAIPNYKEIDECHTDLTDPTDLIEFHE